MTKYDEWTEQHIPRMDGKTVLITGANSGIGYETAKLLAARGAKLVLGVRDLAKGRRAVTTICEATPAVQIDLLPLDLADLASIGRFAEEVRGNKRRLDALINNAGVMAIPQRCTVDGFEMQFGTNHLGHFALTGLLLPLLLRTPNARVVTISSGIHVIGKINFDDLAEPEQLRRLARIRGRASWRTCFLRTSFSASSRGSARSRAAWPSTRAMPQPTYRPSVQRWPSLGRARR